MKKSCLGVRNKVLKIPAPAPCSKCTVPPKCPQNQFFANIPQSIRPRKKIVEAKDVPREISYKIDHSRGSLCLSISLKIFKWVEIEIFAFFHVFGNFFANISRSIRPRGKFEGVENVSRGISYKVGHSRVNLDLPFNLEIHNLKM